MIGGGEREGSNAAPAASRLGDCEIRPARTAAECLACQRAQRAAFGITDDSYLVPVATMVGAQLHGGLTLGAFLPDGTAAGMSFGFLGRIEGAVGLYSQLAAVAPGHQSRGIGRAMKGYQFDWARAEGWDRVGWAFDPLQAGNARFNLRVLGASCGKYVDDMYGPRTDAVNAGVPTDRVIAVKLLETSNERKPDVNDRGAASGERMGAWVVGLARDAAGRRVPSRERERGVGEEFEELWVAIPEGIGELRRSDAGLAEAWRSAVREAFVAAFEAGWRAVDFETTEPGVGGRYILRRDQGRGE